MSNAGKVYTCGIVVGFVFGHYNAMFLCNYYFISLVSRKLRKVVLCKASDIAKAYHANVCVPRATCSAQFVLTRPKLSIQSQRKIKCYFKIKYLFCFMFGW